MPHKTKLYIKIIIIAIVVSGIMGYAFYRTEDLIRGPQILIHSPINGRTVDESLVHIEGVARNISSITLNDKTIFIDESGNIKEEVLLIYGYNIITLYAQDRFGREVTKTLELVYK